jgi:hypothetical protein
MYLEVTRWRHVKPSLAFNSDPIPGTDIRPKPGLPLILVYITCAAAPLTVMATLIRERQTGRLPARGTSAWLDRAWLDRAWPDKPRRSMMGTRRRGSRA